MARLLNKLLIQQTKSRPRHSHDNGLVETKNDAVIRKHMGYGYIDAEHAEPIQHFYNAHLNSYLNYHRPCAQADLEGGGFEPSKLKMHRLAPLSGSIGPNSLCRAKDYFNEFFRRMRAKLGTAQAITASAHKISRILYHVLLTKQPYAETVFPRYDEQAHQRAEMRLCKQAAQLRFQLLPIPAKGE